MTMRTCRVAVLGAAWLAMTVGVAAAQTAPAQTKPATPKRPKEFTIGGVVAGPTSLGSASAELLNGSGQPSVTLFNVDNSLATGFGLEANIGVQLKKSLWLEVSGGWTRSSVHSDISGDFEGADSETISMPMSRFVLEGAVLRYFHDRGASAWFVRVDAGWMRETAGGNTLTGDGFIAGGGIGFRHFWRTNGKGSIKRMGIRVEGRAAIRSGGISLGEEGIRFAPLGAAHLVFGF